MDSQDEQSQLGEGSQAGEGSQLGEGSQASMDEFVDLTQDESQAAEDSQAEVAGGKKGGGKKKSQQELFSGTLPLVLTAGAGKDGKGTLLVEMGERAGGFGVDTGAIGRASFPKVDGKRQFRLDLRGQEYAATIRPCPTMLVLNVSGGEAKVETVLSEYVTLKHTRDARGDDAITEGHFDEGWTTYAGDVDVNAKSRKRDRSQRAGDGDSDADSDQPVEVPKKKRGGGAKPRKPAAAGRGRGRGKK